MDIYGYLWIFMEQIRQDNQDGHNRLRFISIIQTNEPK